MATDGMAGTDMPKPAALRLVCRLIIGAAREETDLALQRLLARHALALAQLAKQIDRERATGGPLPVGTGPPIGRSRSCAVELSSAVSETLAQPGPDAVRSRWARVGASFHPGGAVGAHAGDFGNAR